MKKLLLSAACLVSLNTPSVRALPSHSGEVAAGITAAATAAGMYFLKQEKIEFVFNKSTALFVGAVAGAAALVGYIVDKYTPESKMAWARSACENGACMIQCFENVKSAQEIPALATELYTCSAWPVAVLFEVLQYHCARAADAVVYLDEAMSDRSFDSEFVASAQELKKDVSEVAIALREIMIMVRQSPNFEEQLHNHKMLQLEHQKLIAQQQIAMNSYHHWHHCH